MVNHFESSSEHIPTPAEILEIISRFAERPRMLRELSDAQGTYLLEAVGEGKANPENAEGAEGTGVVYQYIRKGRFPNKVEASETAIYSVIYENGMPCGGDKVAYFDAVAGWITC